MMQEYIVGILFLGAISYIFYRLRQEWSVKNVKGCSKGCGGSCNQIDVEKITQKLEQKEKNILVNSFVNIK